MAQACNPSTLGGRAGWITRSRDQDHPGQRGETPSLPKIQKLVGRRPGMVACACNPSYSGGWGRRIAWTQEAEVAVSRDRTIALQNGQQEQNSCLKKRKKKKSFSNQFICLVFYLPANLVSLGNIHIIFDSVANSINFLTQKRELLTTDSFFSAHSDH